MIKYTGGCYFRLCMGYIILICFRCLPGWAHSKGNERSMGMQVNLTTDFVNCLAQPISATRCLQSYKQTTLFKCKCNVWKTCVILLYIICVSACFTLSYEYSSPQMSNFLVV
uniref:Uncharacterized protein n=1 Tax=Rhipicephalus appendiculatus TaxID=34631 RepID=A0A131YCD3_RHIAP